MRRRWKSVPIFNHLRDLDAKFRLKNTKKAVKIDKKNKK